MALINYGSICDLSVEITERTSPKILALSAADGEKPEAVVRFAESTDRRGLTLSSLTMSERFNGFFGRLFNLETEFYCLAWSWDMTKIHLFPGETLDPKTCIIPLRPDRRERQFIGDGAVFFPPRPVTAGMAVRVQIWESKQDLRDFGAIMKKVGEVVENSTLSGTLALIAAGATGGALVTVQTVQTAAAVLAQEIGGVLAETPDKIVDYFEGYFSATMPWVQGKELYAGVGTEIVLNKIV